jgi:hypothetical protein
VTAETTTHGVLDAAAGARPRFDLRRALRLLPRRPSSAMLYVLGVYLATRLAVAFGSAVASVGRTLPGVGDRAVPWDSFWYLTIARSGYSPTLHPTGLGHHDKYSDWAFYPAFPLVVRAVHEVTRMPIVVAGYVAAGVLGLLAIRAVYALGAQLGGERVGRGSALLLAAWPGSVVLTLPYSEGLFIAATATSVLLFLRRRWWLAGLAGLVSTAARPMGIALVLALLAGAVIEVARRDRREWAAMGAPAVAALGLGGFLLYGDLRTGDWLVWQHAEALWGQRLDFSSHMIETWITRLSQPDSYRATQAILEIAGMTVLVAGLVAAGIAWRRLTAPVLVYAAVSAAMVLGYSQVATRPRMILAVFPVFIGLARILPPRVVEVLGVALASTIALVTFLYIGDPHLLP